VKVTATAPTALPLAAPGRGEGPRCAVFALGSVLMGDDGVGASLLAHLEARWELPPEVTLLDLGTPGPDLADWFAGYQAVVVVDALRLAGAPPGTVRELSRAELAQLPRGPRMSPHDPGIGEALLKAELTGEAPRDLVLVGIVPARAELATTLSPPVAAALEEAEARVIALLERWGVAARKRREPLPVRAFWTDPSDA
jgi:hydrogenase maturation protease